MVKFLLVGLGNPGPEYADTRHNVGFLVVDRIAQLAEATWSSERLAEMALFRSRGRGYVLLRPTTFMNLSGMAVRYWADKERIPLDRILVISDDLALPFGKVRLRGGGGAGGHNGLTDIIANLGTDRFARLRVGIGADFPRGRQSEFVLRPWTEQEKKDLPKVLEGAAEAARDFVHIGLAQAMNRHNQRPGTAEDPA
ncbi:MAG: aminoacyl-tRNA hydrolase [Flavobacteriales bacterium]|nr:aminoacyl-tRNA hydrolase [Flavobacteriales bacterium]